MFYSVNFNVTVSEGIIQYYCNENNVEYKYVNRQLRLNLPDDKTYQDNMIDEIEYILQSYLSRGFFSVEGKYIDKIKELMLLWNGEILWTSDEIDSSKVFIVGKIKMCENITNNKYYFMTDSDKWVNKTIEDIEHDNLPLIFLKNDYQDFEKNFVEYSLSTYDQTFFIKKIHTDLLAHTYLVELIGLHDINNIYEKYSKDKVPINFYNKPYLSAEYLVSPMHTTDTSVSAHSGKPRHVHRHTNLADVSAPLIEQKHGGNIDPDILEQYNDKEEDYLVEKTQYEYEDNCDLIWCKSIKKYFKLKSVF